MKRPVLISLSIVSVVIIGLCIFLYFWMQPLAINKVLPQKLFLYLHFSDTTGSLEEIQQNALWRRLKMIDYDRLMKELKWSPQQRAFIQNVVSQISSPQTSQIIGKLFGHEVAVGIYPVNMDLAKLKQTPALAVSSVLEQLFSGLFLVTRVDRDVQLTEFVANLLGQPRRRIPMDVVDYRGYKIHTVQIEGLPGKLAFARLKDLFVISLGEKAAQRSIDVLSGKESSLVKDGQFEKGKSQALVNPEFLGFIDAQALFNFIAEQIKIASPEQYEQFKKGSGGFKSFVVSTASTEVFQMKFDLAFDPREMDPLAAQSYSSCASSANQTINFVPQDVLFYQWNNCFDLEYIWNVVKRELVRTSGQAKEKISVDGQIKQLEAALGLNVEKDIIPAFGKEISGYLMDIEMTEYFPVPKFVIAVKMADQNKMKNLIDRLINQQAVLTFSQDNYSGVNISSVNLPLEGDFKPSYCFLDDYLLLTPHRSLIEKTIDIYNKKNPSLSTSEEFRSVNQGLTGQNMNVQFIGVSRLVKRIRAIVEWANLFAEKTDAKRQAFRTGSQKRLEDVKIQFITHRKELDRIKEQVNYYENEVKTLQSQGSDTSEKEKYLKDAQTQRQDKEKEILDNRDEIKRLEEILKGYQTQVSDRKTREFWIKDVTGPVLDGLEMTRSIGTKSLIRNNILETTIYIK